MRVHNHHTDSLMTPQSLSRGGEAWTTAVVPRLPANLAEQARELKAFPRVRGIATPHDLWRGLLADVLGPLSTRRLGAWAVLSGLADIAEAAWRKRLRARNDWLLWLVGALRAVSEAPAPSVPQLAGCLLVVDARGLRPPGGPGDDGRLHLAYDLRAGRMHQGWGTDRRGGAHLARYQGPAGAVIVADRGEGYRRSVATAVRQQAEVVVRIHPATFPREPEEGHPVTGLRWLRQRGGPEREWPGWWCWEGRRYPVRLVAAPRTPAAAQQARRRQRRQAPKAGRLRTMPTRAVAGWLLVITTRDVGTWSAAAGLSGYRARWQGERVCKKMQQRLRRNQMRRKHRTSVEATVRALLVAWALHAGTTSLLRTLVSAPATTETVVSSWLVSGVGLDTVRQQGQGRWSEARLQVCLPRLRRFLWSRPRRRGHQEGAVRAWLAQRASPCFGSQQQVA